MFMQFFSHYNDGYSMMGGSDWSWALFMMLFWVVIFITLVVLVTRAVSTGQADGQKNNDAISIAKTRYARGEITKKEFEQLRKDLISN